MTKRVSVRGKRNTKTARPATKAKKAKKVWMMKNADSRNDAVLQEFEERDLGKDIEASGAGVMIRKQRPTSILMSDELKAALRKRGAKIGVGYQTVAKMILQKYMNAKL